jgi:hypothetical protein
LFDFGLTFKDSTRIGWTFVQGVLGYALATVIGWVPGSAFDWKAFGVGLLAAGLSAIKNGVLSDTSRIK